MKQGRGDEQWSERSPSFIINAKVLLIATYYFALSLLILTMRPVKNSLHAQVVSSSSKFKLNNYNLLMMVKLKVCNIIVI